jgi:hypothetical protein
MPVLSSPSKTPFAYIESSGLQHYIDSLHTFIPSLFNIKYRLFFLFFKVYFHIVLICCC